MKRIRTHVTFTFVVSAAVICGFLCTNSQNGYHLQLASAAVGKRVINSTNTIQLGAKEVKNGVYNWIDSSNAVSNPTIKALTNTKNIIKIQNPTDTKHELIIDTGADVLPSSDDIAPNGSGQLVFSPNMTGTFTYHCAYHPFTMKGTIQVNNTP